MVAVSAVEKVAAAALLPPTGADSLLPYVSQFPGEVVPPSVAEPFSAVKKVLPAFSAVVPVVSADLQASSSQPNNNQ